MGCTSFFFFFFILYGSIDRQCKRASSMCVQGKGYLKSNGIQASSFNVISTRSIKNDKSRASIETTSTRRTSFDNFQPRVLMVRIKIKRSQVFSSLDTLEGSIPLEVFGLSESAGLQISTFRRRIVGQNISDCSKVTKTILKCSA